MFVLVVCYYRVRSGQVYFTKLSSRIYCNTKAHTVGETVSCIVAISVIKTG